MDGWFDLTTAGVAGYPNSYFRIFNGATRIASVYRYATNGQLWMELLQPSGTWARTRLTSQAVSLAAWHNLQLAFMPAGADSTVQVWLDGTLLYSNNKVAASTLPVTSIMLGSEGTAQQGDTYIDDVIVKAAPNTPVDCTSNPPASTLPGKVVVADGFECGNLDNWVVRMMGDGVAQVQTSPVYAGSYAACMSVSATSPSLANFSHAVPSGATDVYADARIDVMTEGPAGNDVPYLRFFTGSTRIADIYRYNSTGQLWLRILTPAGSFAYYRLTTAAIALNTWHQVQMHVAPGGTNSTIEVTLDGTQVFSSAAVNMATGPVQSVLLGSEHYPQPGAFCADNVVIKSLP